MSVKQCLIRFETAVHCRELELHLFNKWLRDKCICFTSGNLWDKLLHTLWFCVLNKNGSLIRVLKPLYYLCLTCFNNELYQTHCFLKIVCYLACIQKSCELIFFLSFYVPFLIRVMCIKMLNLFQRVESIHQTQTGFSLLFNNYQLSLFLFCNALILK